MTTYLLTGKVVLIVFWMVLYLCSKTSCGRRYKMSSVCGLLNLKVLTSYVYLLQTALHEYPLPFKFKHLLPASTQRITDLGFRSTTGR